MAEIRVCDQCGSSFEAKRRDSLRCSLRCRDRANYARTMADPERKERRRRAADGWKSLNSDKVKESTRKAVAKYRAANLSKVQASNAECLRRARSADPERFALYRKKFQAQHSDRLAMEARERRSADPDKARAAWKKSYYRNRERVLSRARSAHRGDLAAASMQEALMALPEIEKLIASHGEQDAK